MQKRNPCGRGNLCRRAKPCRMAKPCGRAKPRRKENHAEGKIMQRQNYAEMKTTHEDALLAYLALFQ